MADSADGHKADGKRHKMISESDDQRARKPERKRRKIGGKLRLKTMSDSDLRAPKFRRFRGLERFAVKKHLERSRIDPEIILLDKRIAEQSADTALEYYNEQNPGADFELVEAIICNVFMDMSVIEHVNFTAKSKNVAFGDSSPKLFFAELTYLRREGMEPDESSCRCSIVDSTNSEITSGCGYCDPNPRNGGPKIYHVDGVFHHGCFEYGTRSPCSTIPLAKEHSDISFPVSRTLLWK